MLDSLLAAIVVADGEGASCLLGLVLSLYVMAEAAATSASG